MIFSKKKFLIGVNCLSLFLLVNCQSNNKPNASTSNKNEFKLVIDSLVLSRTFNDSINYSKYLNRDTNLFLRLLIDRIDADKKLMYLGKFRDNPLFSNRETIESYAGVKSICILNGIICDTVEFNNDLCLNCYVHGLSKGMKNIDLNTLGQFKKIYLEWFEESKQMSLKDRKKLWNKTYSKKYEIIMTSLE